MMLTINIAELMEEDWGQGIRLFPKKTSCQIEVPTRFRGDGNWDADRCWADIEAGAVREMGLRLDFARAARVKPGFYAQVRDYMAQSYVEELGTDVLAHFEVKVSSEARAGESATVDLTGRETGEKIKALAYRDKDENLDCQDVIDALEKGLQKRFYWRTGQKLFSAAQREAICKKLNEKVEFKKYTYKYSYRFYIEQDTHIPIAGVFSKGEYEIWGSIFISNNKLKIFAEAYTKAKDEGVTPYFYMTVSLLKYGKVVDSKGLDPGIRMDSLYPGRNIRMGVAYFNLEPASKFIEYELKIKTGYAYTLAEGKGWSKVARRNIPIEVVEVK
jgi:hypothetical protein